MTPLKIKITVRDKALEMQVLEQDERLRSNNDRQHIYHNGEMTIQSDLFPALYEDEIFLRGKITSDDNFRHKRYFIDNIYRDAYLTRVKKLMSDFHRAWKAGEVEVLS